MSLINITESLNYTRSEKVQKMVIDLPEVGSPIGGNYYNLLNDIIYKKPMLRFIHDHIDQITFDELGFDYTLGVTLAAIIIQILESTPLPDFNGNYYFSINTIPSELAEMTVRAGMRLANESLLITSFTAES